MKETMPTHLVVNFIIVKDNKFLLERKDTGKWRLPGGHLEAGETPLEAVRREAKEELGLSIRVISEAPIIEDTELVNSLPIPINMYSEIVEKDSNFPLKHINIGMIYALKTDEEPIPKESQQIKWFNIDELKSNNIMQPIIACCRRATQIENETKFGKLHLY